MHNIYFGNKFIKFKLFLETDTWGKKKKFFSRPVKSAHRMASRKTDMQKIAKFTLKKLHENIKKHKILIIIKHLTLNTFTFFVIIHTFGNTNLIESPIFTTHFYVHFFFCFFFFDANWKCFLFLCWLLVLKKLIIELLNVIWIN